MKKIFFLFILNSFLITFSYAQKAPQGMKYQAVARNTSGEVMANEKISLRINLASVDDGKSVNQFSEVHDVVTNELGLFTLVIGEGRPINGGFKSIPWSTGEIWMEIAIKEKTKSDFIVISNSKLLAVPYAFHAATASEIVGTSSSNMNNSGEGSSGNVWSLKGNSRVDAATDRLGTTENDDLVVITNNIERFRISRSGPATMHNKFTLAGKALFLDSLELHKAARLRNSLMVDGPSIFLDSLNLLKAAHLRNSLTVDGRSIFLDSLEVHKAAHLKNSLIVDGRTFIGDTLELLKAARLRGSLTVDGRSIFLDSLELQKPVHLRGSLLVDGQIIFGDSLDFRKAAHLKSSLKVDGPSIFADSLSLLKAARMKSSLTVDGPSILLDSLNLEKAAYLKSSLKVGGPSIFLDSLVLEKMANLRSSLKVDGPSIFLDSLVLEKMANLKSSLKVGGPSIFLDSLVLEKAANLKSSLKVGGPSIFLDSLVLEKMANLKSSLQVGGPSIFFDSLVLEKAANLKSSLKVGGPSIFLDSLVLEKAADLKSSLQVGGPSIFFDSLTSRGVLNVYGNAFFHGTVEFEHPLTASSINSKNGDYAEWLERIDPNEEISTGDIIAVKGGKITKNLKGAEQILAVSFRPVVLGNLPAKERQHLGNDIAFLGQIPVKVMGAVQPGDFIVAKGEIPGYGIAVHANDMTIEDFKLAVGRSWEQNENTGPKMVNTVVGVHNNDFLNILKTYMEKLDETDKRLRLIEEKLNISTGNSKPAKKGF